jgi:hypothetical protein
MKKIVLVFLLLLVVVAISYFKSVRDQSSRQKLYQEGLDKGTSEATVYRQQSDSLKDLLDRRQTEFTDSTTRLVRMRQAETDSLKQIIADRDQALKQAAQKKKSAVLKTPVKPKPADSSQTSNKHYEILAYYKRRLQELPKDLSDYEKKVALNEVREETVKKFSISLTELEQLRLANNISE